MARNNHIIDFLRVVACFMIVGRHVGFSPMTATATMVSNFCDYGVAVFAVISGYLMSSSFASSSQYDFWGYCCRRAKRLLPLYFVWSLFYVIVRSVFDLLFDGGEINPIFKTVEFWLGVVFSGEAAGHLWFMIVLFYCQILVAMLWYTSLLKPIIVQITLCLLSFVLMCRLPGYWGYHFMRLMAFLFLGFTLRNFVKLPNMVSEKPYIALKVLGTSTLGIYLIHPFFIIGIRNIAERIFSAPFTFFAVTVVWVISYFVSLIFVLVIMKQNNYSRRIIGMK